MRVRRITGGREELMEDLPRAGLRVLEDDDPLAVAHREIQHARRESTGGSRSGVIQRAVRMRARGSSQLTVYSPDRLLRCSGVHERHAHSARWGLRPGDSFDKPHLVREKCESVD